MLRNARQNGINHTIHNSSNENMCKRNTADEKSKEFEIGSDAEAFVG